METNGSSYNRSIPIIFIGGFARSGSRIAKILLESFSTLKCSLENGVITEAVSMATRWKASSKETTRLNAAHVTPNVNYIFISLN